VATKTAAKAAVKAVASANDHGPLPSKESAARDIHDGSPFAGMRAELAGQCITGVYMEYSDLYETDYFGEIRTGKSKRSTKKLNLIHTKSVHIKIKIKRCMQTLFMYKANV
jgi:hypothetical protein